MIQVALTQGPQARGPLLLLERRGNDLGDEPRRSGVDRSQLQILLGAEVAEQPAHRDAAHADQYPEHSHAEDGQEEVYTAMSGPGEIEIEGVRHRIDPETMISVGPGVTRKVVTGDDALRLLIIGGVPVKPYDPPEFSKLGTPDPTKAQTA